MKRRVLLGTLGSALAGGLAGCTGSPGAGGANATTTTTTATTTTTTTAPSASADAGPTTGTSTTTDAPCENGGQLVEGVVVEYGTLAGFELTANRESVAVGERIGFRLENVTDEEKLSGNRSKYTIHRETEAGWRDVFYPAPDAESRPAYHDDGVIQPPGEGFTWELTFSQSGLAHDVQHGAGSLDVCTPLRPGTYRFVYWGVVGDPVVEGDSERDHVLGARFSVSNR